MWLVTAVLDSSNYITILSLQKILLSINKLEDNTEIKFEIAVIINILEYKHRKLGEFN